MIHPMDLLYPTPLTDAYLEELEKHPKYQHAWDHLVGTLIGTWLIIGDSDEKILSKLKETFKDIFNE